MSDDLSEEIKAALRDVKLGHIRIRNYEILAEWAKHERAMRKKAEFEKEHRTASGLDDGRRCVICLYSVRDPCHTWTDTKWDESVERELAG